jgi:2,4-dienoyl-CoA reductase-like NADH-dependent reductase (Old Yellow Enzyme family)
MANKLAVVCSYFGYRLGRWRLECRRICTAFYTLKRKGVDLIDVSSGALVPYQKIPVAPNYQVPFAEQIKRKRNLTVGLITEAHQTEEIISSGKADLVLFARESLKILI